VENSNDDQRVIGGHHGRTAIGAATDLGLVSQDGERVSTMLTIDDKCFRLSLEPVLADTLPELRNAMPPIVRQ
jgi:hypothetical protein